MAKFEDTTRHMIDAAMADLAHKEQQADNMADYAEAVHDTVHWLFRYLTSYRLTRAPGGAPNATELTFYMDDTELERVFGL